MIFFGRLVFLYADYYQRFGLVGDGEPANGSCDRVCVRVSREVTQYGKVKFKKTVARAGRVFTSLSFLYQIFGHEWWIWVFIW